MAMATMLFFIRRQTYRRKLNHVITGQLTDAGKRAGETSYTSMRYLYVTFRQREEVTSRTSGNAQHSHDADDGRIDGNEAGVHLLQYNSSYRQHHYCQIQLIPPTAKHTRLRRTCGSIGT